MPLSPEVRQLVDLYCKRDLPQLQWHVDQFSFVAKDDLKVRLGRAFYAARYLGKLSESLQAAGEELHPFLKFQIIQYASIYEAVISYLLWERYGQHAETLRLERHKAFKPVSALGCLTSMKYDAEQLFTCVYRDEKTTRSSISFRDKVDCAVLIGFVNSQYADEIKSIYALRNMAHIENEAERKIELELLDARQGYWRMQPFLDGIRKKISESDP